MRTGGINLLPKEILEQRRAHKKRGASLVFSVVILAVLLLTFVVSFWFNKQSRQQLVQARSARQELNEKIRSLNTAEGLYRNLFQKVQTFKAQDPFKLDAFVLYNKVIEASVQDVAINRMEWKENNNFIVGGDAQNYNDLNEYLLLLQNSPTLKNTSLQTIRVQSVSFDEEKGRVEFEVHFVL